MLGRTPAAAAAAAALVLAGAVHSAGGAHRDWPAPLCARPRAPRPLASRACPVVRDAGAGLPLPLQLRLRGGRMQEPAPGAARDARGAAEGGDLDAEIEQIISNEAMLEDGGGGHAGAGGGATASKGRGLPRPDPMQIFREVSGSAVHFYDWPSANNSHFRSTDGDRTWKSDRHHIIMDEWAPVFDVDAVVDFDDGDQIKMREYWDAGYNMSLNVSEESASMEVSDDGKSAHVRLQSGDSITDHVIGHVYMGLDMELRAIANNMTRTNWTPPPGWHFPAGAPFDTMPLEELLQHASYCPPNASYATWGEARGSGVSRWALQVTGKIGPVVLGAAVPPLSPAGVMGNKLRSPAWGMTDQGFSFHSDGSGNGSQRDLVVAGQVGMNCWPPYFGQGAIIWMVLDRDQRTLQFTVNSLPPFALYGVDPLAVPFVSALLPGDGIRLLSMREAMLAMPTNLRNDLVARWSISELTLPPLKTRKAKRGKAPPPQPAEGRVDEDQELPEADQPRGHVEHDDWYKPRHVQFWPGGRLRGPEFDSEQRILQHVEQMVTQEDLDHLLACLAHTPFEDQCGK